MNRETKNSILTGALGVSLLLSIIFCLLYIKTTREFRQLALDVNVMNAARARMSVLVNVSMKYAETNPAIDPYIEPFGLKPKDARRDAAKSAPK